MVYPLATLIAWAEEEKGHVTFIKTLFKPTRMTMTMNTTVWVITEFHVWWPGAPLYNRLSCHILASFSIQKLVHQKRHFSFRLRNKNFPTQTNSLFHALFVGIWLLYSPDRSYNFRTQAPSAGKDRNSTKLHTAMSMHQTLTWFA